MSIDVIGLIEVFYLVILPLMVAAAVLAPLLPRRRGATPMATDPLAEAEARRHERERTARRIGLLNYAAAARALVQLVPRLHQASVTGDYGSIPILDFGLPPIVIAANVAIGLGLRRLRPWARWAEAAWNALVAAVGLAASAWLWHFGAAVAPAEWPDLAAGRVLPLFLLVAMLLPGTARDIPGVASGRPGRPIVAALTRGFLVILAAIVVVDSLDWIARVRFEVGSSGPGSPSTGGKPGATLNLAGSSDAFASPLPTRPVVSRSRARYALNRSAKTHRQRGRGEGACAWTDFFRSGGGAS